ncbi:GAF domain-containing protein [Rhodoblastus acidophilus]|uniref:GAF domain-containing protein n=1 Tax=Candidatus Rhodoblastus alkanivorans TaxID=2954117 RepID=A0ABS9Z0W4_9HYPH|nr:GAF domain-containing protein [Candidatus Rhodoblastus alkanivorans]MCI4678228.1 GAF domain-containing protein [Candidatus Rhodoblastus alkanivorans]MCI4681278.1 GAF domain-containing protein [Candidatus Rhodoblastus alkanivorans]MDI4642325.1 GAF domain-containing protein [Rhodoblastus acidophilus]
MTPKSPDITSRGMSPAIQPHGWMIVCDDQAARIVGHSANLSGLFPATEKGFSGLLLRDLLGSETSHALRNGLSRTATAPRAALLPRLPIAGLAGLYDFAVHAAGDLTVIEIESAAEADPFALDRVRALFSRLASVHGLDRLAVLAARLVQAILQWDCATVLRLGSDGAQVLAQQRRLDWPDAAANAILCTGFSQDARANLRAARLRFVADVAAAPVKLIGTKAPDLDRTLLRAATADEISRAGKTGFAALLSLPLIVDDALWGVLLAHDGAARRLTMDERAVLDLFGDFLSLSIQAALAREAADEFRRRHAL